MFKWLKKTVKDAVKTVRKAQPGRWAKGVITAPKDTFLRKLTGKYWFDEVALGVTGQWAGLGGDVVMNILVDERRKAMQKRENATQKEIQERAEERIQQFGDQGLSEIDTGSSPNFSKVMIVAGAILILMLLFKKK